MSARAALAATTGPDGLIYAIGGADGSSNTFGTVEAYTTDKCYPIEQQIAVVENNLSIAMGNLSDLPHRPGRAPRRRWPLFVQS